MFACFKTRLGSVGVLALLCLAAPAPTHAEDLLQTYARALDQDPQIHEAEATRNAVREIGPQSLARLLPTLAVTGSLGMNRYDTTATYAVRQFGIQNFWDSSVYLRLSQPLYHREYWVQLSQADNQIAQAEAEYAYQHQDLIVRTAKAYFGVLAAENNVEFAAAERIALVDQAGKTQQRFDAGMVPITDLLEARAGADQSVAQENAAIRALHLARVALQEIIGKFEMDLDRLREDLPLEPPVPEELDKWNELSQRTNLGILGALNQVEVARKNIELQFSGHMPTFDLVANVGYQDTDRPQGVVANSQTVGVQMNIPILQGGGVNSRVRQAQHQLKAASDGLDKLRRGVNRQVQDAYDGVLYTISQIKALKTAVASSERAAQAAELGLDAGTRTAVDVLTTQRNLLRARRDYNQARCDYVINGLLLKQGAGTLSVDDVKAVNRWLHAPGSPGEPQTPSGEGRPGRSRPAPGPSAPAPGSSRHAGS